MGARFDFAARRGLGLDDAIVSAVPAARAARRGYPARPRRSPPGAWLRSCAPLRRRQRELETGAALRTRAAHACRRHAQQRSRGRSPARDRRRRCCLRRVPRWNFRTGAPDHRPADPAPRHPRVTRSNPSSAIALTVARVPGGVYLARLSKRLLNTCTISLASTCTGGSSAPRSQLDPVLREPPLACVARPPRPGHRPTASRGATPAHPPRNG